MNSNFFERQQYIKRNNELKKGPNLDSLVQGNRKRVEMNRKLDELSLNSNYIVSGNVVRNNIISSSSSSITTLNNTVDNEVYIDNNNSNSAETIRRNINPNIGKNNFMNNLK